MSWWDLAITLAVYAVTHSLAFLFGMCWYRTWLCADCPNALRGLLTRKEDPKS